MKNFLLIVAILLLAGVNAAERKHEKKQVPNALHLNDHFGHHPLFSPYGPRPKPVVVAHPVTVVRPVVSQPISIVRPVVPVRTAVVRPVVHSVVTPVVAVDPQVQHVVAHPQVRSFTRAVYHHESPNTVIVHNTPSYPRVVFGHDIVPGRRRAHRFLKKPTFVKQTCDIVSSPFYNHCQSLTDCGLCAASPHCGWCA